MVCKQKQQNFLNILPNQLYYKQTHLSFSKELSIRKTFWFSKANVISSSKLSKLYRRVYIWKSIRYSTQYHISAWFINQVCTTKQVLDKNKLHLQRQAFEHYKSKDTW